jgi:hypothetical protein
MNESPSETIAVVDDPGPACAVGAANANAPATANTAATATLCLFFLISPPLQRISLI